MSQVLIAFVKWPPSICAQSEVNSFLTRSDTGKGSFFLPGFLVAAFPCCGFLPGCACFLEVMGFGVGIVREAGAAVSLACARSAHSSHGQPPSPPTTTTTGTHQSCPATCRSLFTAFFLTLTLTIYNRAPPQDERIDLDTTKQTSEPPAPAPGPPRKRPRLDFNQAAGERKRGKTVFGILVGTLNKAKIEDKERNASDAVRISHTSCQTQTKFSFFFFFFPPWRSALF